MHEKYLSLANILASQLGTPLHNVENIITLLNDKITVPYIAKYCKLQSGGASLKNIRLIANAVDDIKALEEKRSVVQKCIESQDKLSDELRESINKADTMQTLEDIYLLYRPERQNKASQALQRGLEPLSQELLTTYAISPEACAEKFVNPDKGVFNNNMALDGARQILLEKLSLDVNFLNIVRKYFWEHATLNSVHSKNRQDKNAHKYKEFANYSKSLDKIPNQKLFELFAGRAENYLKISINLANGLDYGFDTICNYFDLDKEKVMSSSWMKKVITDTWNIKLIPKLEAEILHSLREMASSSAGKDLSNYFRGLFYQAGTGNVITMGIVPNVKNGVAVAVVDEYGCPLDSQIIYPLGLYGDWHQSLASLAKLAVRFNVSLISIANMPSYRHIERLCRDLAKMYRDLKLSVNIVDAYSIMEYANSSECINDLDGYDEGARAAISVAKRSQNPLSYYAKINSKDLSLLQYDFLSSKYQKVFDEAIQDSICSIGLDINKAEYYTLRKLPGLTDDIARKIIEYRKQHGNFKSRAELNNVPGIEENIFKQVAGFIYVYDGSNILDTLNIHPDSYYIVEKMAKNLAVDLSYLITHPSLLDKINPTEYTDNKHGIECIKNIVNWVKYKDKDPRVLFALPKYNKDIVSINDLYKDLELEGIVSQISDFGVFVDVGVFKAGLIPLPIIKDKIGTNIRVGKVIKVQVADVDKVKKRFSLILKTHEKYESPKFEKSKIRPDTIKKPQAPVQKKHVFNTAMADALAKLKKGEDI